MHFLWRILRIGKIVFIKMFSAPDVFLKAKIKLNSWGCFIRFQDRLFSKYLLWDAIKGNYFLGHIFPAASHGRCDTGNLVR